MDERHKYYMEIEENILKPKLMFGPNVWPL